MHLATNLQGGDGMLLIVMHDGTCRTGSKFDGFWYPHRVLWGTSLVGIAPQPVDLFKHAQVQLTTDWPCPSLFSAQKVRNLTHPRSLRSTRPTCSAVRNKTQVTFEEVRIAPPGSALQC